MATAERTSGNHRENPMTVDTGASHPGAQIDRDGLAGVSAPTTPPRAVSVHGHHAVSVSVAVVNIPAPPGVGCWSGDLVDAGIALRCLAPGARYTDAGDALFGRTPITPAPRPRR